MKKYLLIFLFGFYIKGSFGQGYPSGNFDKITQYCDDFKNTAISNLWNTTTWYGSSWMQEGVLFESSRVSSGNSSSSDPTNTSGFLRITPYTTGDTIICEGEPIQCFHKPKYYSGCLQSRNAFRYGYFETWIKLPGDNLYSCSAWWSAAGCNPYVTDLYNEIDVFETGRAYELGTNVFVGTSNCSYSCDYSYSHLPNISRASPADVTASFHTYGLEWMPDYINVYFDGAIYKHITQLQFNGVDDRYGLISSVNPENIPQQFLFWVKRGGADQTNYPNGIDHFLEVDYFNYYKHKPVLINAVYNSTNNTITLTADTGDPNDSYSWQTVTPYVSINGVTNTNVAQIALAPAYSGVSVKVTATGTYPSASSSSIFTFQQGSGNICSIPNQSNVYMASTINAPQSGCSSVIVVSGTNVTFVAPSSITLNSGFEVQLGATFNALTQ
jgi:beta-glucanase (GH16 family)